MRGADFKRGIVLGVGNVGFSPVSCESIHQPNGIGFSVIRLTLAFC